MTKMKTVIPIATSREDGGQGEEDIVKVGGDVDCGRTWL